MKHIEIRVWNTPNKIMYCDLVGIAEFNKKGLFVKNCEVMLYSGIKDKFGEKIFDKDIIKVRTWKGLRNFIFLVNFNNGAFRVGESANGELLGGFDDVEKLGNYFENRGLLKK